MPDLSSEVKSLFLLLLGMLLSGTLSCQQSLEMASAKKSSFASSVALNFAGSLHLLTDQLRGVKHLAPLGTTFPVNLRSSISFGK